MLNFSKKKENSGTATNASTSLKKNEVKVDDIQFVMPVKFMKKHEDAVLPFYGSDDAMGMDITAVDVHYDEESDCHVYHTGLAVEIPKGYGMFAFPRSSNRKTEAYMPNHVPIIDADYRGHITISYKNRDRNVIKQPYNVGDRVCQVVIMPYPKIAPEWADELSETKRGEGSYGSTGK